MCPRHSGCRTEHESYSIRWDGAGSHFPRAPYNHVLLAVCVVAGSHEGCELKHTPQPQLFLGLSVCLYVCFEVQ